MSTEAVSATSSEIPAELLLHDDWRPPVGAAHAPARRGSALRRYLLGADLLTGALSGAATGALAHLALPHVLLLTAVLAASWPVVAFVCGLYASEDLQAWTTGISDAPKLIMSCLLLSWPVFGLVSALGAGTPVAGALGASVVTAAGAGLFRAGARARLHRAASLRQRTLVIGSGVVANQLVDRLQSHPELGLAPVGYIDDETHLARQADLPALGQLADLADVLDWYDVDRVMIAFSRAGHQQLLECIRVCRDRGVAVDIVPRLFEFLHGAQTVNQLGGMPLMSIDPPRFAPLSRIAKRGLDIAGATFALILIGPLLAIIALAIKLDSRGSVLFVQERAGRGGDFFRLFKFRSMRTGSDVLVRDDGAIVKSRDDNRITRMGRLIRRFSLDEAPQLLNVLKGDMSLVGPRPLVRAEAEALTEGWQARRADLRPGLTGPWQVSGRSHIPFHEMIQFDYQYVAGWSLARDLELLLATVPAVLSGRGAY